MRARFGNCQRCGRLIAVGGVNQNGDCTKECGGCVHPPPIVPTWSLMAALSAAHRCSDPSNCAFGGVGCHDENGLIEGVEPS